MAATRIKSLGKTGLVTRAKAEAAVRAWKKAHPAPPRTGGERTRIGVGDTATGRGLVKFHIPDHEAESRPVKGRAATGSNGRTKAGVR
jgi:hypothetical protein